MRLPRAVGWLRSSESKCRQGRSSPPRRERAFRGCEIERNSESKREQMVNSVWWGREVQRENRGCALDLATGGPLEVHASVVWGWEWRGSQCAACAL